MTTINSFYNLDVWQNARSFTREIYQLTNNFPNRENYGLKNQITRAAVSIMSNIAEGFHRYSKKEFIKFLIISRGSIAEVESHLFVALDLKYITKEQFNDIYSKSVDIFKQINSFIRYLRKCKEYNDYEKEIEK
jgi:four helix bundle protein